jgi:hypothetical protein
MDKQQGLWAFWSMVGIPAYAEGQVPKDAEFPYITYQKLHGDFESQVYPMGTIWTRDSSWEQADSYENQISQILEGGQQIEIDSGYIQIDKGNPFSQQTGDDNDELVKGYRINLQVSYLCAY